MSKHTATGGRLPERESPVAKEETPVTCVCGAPLPAVRSASGRAARKGSKCDACREDDYRRRCREANARRRGKEGGT